MRKRKATKRVLSLALALMLMLALVPMTATVGAADDFEIVDGVLVKYNGAGGAVVIPDGVTEISDAFRGCENLTSVTIGNSVIKIGEYAFTVCENLTSVTMGNSVTSIGMCAFIGCTSLLSVNIPNSVVSIGEYAFGYFFYDGFTKIEGFTINGVAGSEAEKYAKANDIKFVAGAGDSTPTTPATPKVGDKLGDVLHTDIKAYINGNAIPSYNINGSTAVVVEDLEYYGFNLKWDGTARTISVVSYDKTKTVKPLEVSASTGATGSVAFPHVYTDIIAYIDGNEVVSYNINGKTCIIIDDLDAYGKVTWDGAARTINFTAG